MLRCIKMAYIQKQSTLDNSHKTLLYCIPRARANLQAKRIPTPLFVKLLHNEDFELHLKNDNIELDQVTKDLLTVYQSIMNTANLTHSVQLLRSSPCRLPSWTKKWPRYLFFFLLSLLSKDNFIMRGSLPLIL